MRQAARFGLRIATRARAAGITILACFVIAIMSQPTAVLGGTTIHSPPLIVFDQASAVGPVVRSADGPIELATVALTDSFGIPVRPPRDTIPAQSQIEFRWHSEPTAAGIVAVAYWYKFDEPAFVHADSSVHAVSYDAGVGGDVVAPGTKIFTLRVIDNQGDFRETTRYFQMNYAPETWFAGPDTTTLDARYGWSGHDRHLDIANWNGLPDLSGSLLSCDSLVHRPAERAHSKTFLEIYGNRLFVRTENDTVHMNSWVLIGGGGSDLDSPYLVKVAPGDPALDDTMECAPAGEPREVRPAGLIGSPIGLDLAYCTALDTGGPLIQTARSTLFPLFDPGSPNRMPVVTGYLAASHSGKIYLCLLAEDADGGIDKSIGSAGTARAIAERVDSGFGTPQEIALRPKVLTFFVNKSPVLRTNDPAFVPHANQSFSTRTLELNLLADDEDPFDPAGPSPGGPSTTKVLRWTIRLAGIGANGAPDSTLPITVFDPHVTLEVPASFAPPDASVLIELCDCANCEDNPGEGRCVLATIPVQIPDVATATLVSLVSSDATPSRARLTWQLGAPGNVHIERRSRSLDWQDLGEVVADGNGRVTFEDPTVQPGERYGYRVALSNSGSVVQAGEAWVDVPGKAVFSLEKLRPSPTRSSDLRVSFSLSNAAPARIEVLDASGRRVLRCELSSAEPGRHVVDLSSERIRPGVYMIVLKQGSRVASMRAVVLN